MVLTKLQCFICVRIMLKTGDDPDQVPAPQLHKDYAGVQGACLNQAAELHLYQNHTGDSGDDPDQVVALDPHQDQAGDSGGGQDQVPTLYIHFRIRLR